jgi:hypothetical protein
VGVDGFPYEENALSILTLAEFLARATKEAPDSLWLHSVPLAKFDEATAPMQARMLQYEKVMVARLLEDFGSSADVGAVSVRNPPLLNLVDDLGSFTFLGPNPPRSRFYVPWRVFVYRNSFTDFHSHRTDSALMCQAVGKKHVVLFAPTPGFPVLMDVCRRTPHSYLATRDEFPELFGLKPLRVTVEQGDALHIPIYWWHAVKAPKDGLGATVTYSWRSPAHVDGDFYFHMTRERWNDFKAQRNRAVLARLASYRTWSVLFRTWKRVQDRSWDHRA